VASSLRHSDGLREFHNELKGQQGLRVLDLGAASQANISFFTELGHKVYTEDVYPVLTGNNYRLRDENGRGRLDGDAFLAENLNYQMLLFDAVICWDLLDQLEESMVRPLVDRLHRIVKPGGALLAFFHTAEPGSKVQVHRYRIQAVDTLELLPRGDIVLRRPLNNRNIENLFKDFHSLKFFLARDNLREVLVVR
jgi:2-polyprenyl-3-methyl-5-hydroxy-6-metoxy-1,4-benzoquinol methylase